VPSLFTRYRDRGSALIRLNVDVARPQCVALDEVAAWLDFVAHEHGEYAVGLDGVICRSFLL
jgi:hypothetical protein